MSNTVRELHDLFLARFGPQHWWPAETPFEVVVGAILTQNTNWSNVEKAIAALKANGLMEPSTLIKASPSEVARLIKPAGYYNVKTKRLSEFLKWFRDEFELDMERMASVGKEDLRERLLSVKGIGKETADSILLYALNKPVFVVDAYTYRVFTRHGMVTREAAYEELKEMVESSAPGDTEFFNEFHALIVNAGKVYCRKAALCSGCPGRPLLPNDKPIEDALD